MYNQFVKQMRIIYVKTLTNFNVYLLKQQYNKLHTVKQRINERLKMLKSNIIIPWYNIYLYNITWFNLYKFIEL